MSILTITYVVKKNLSIYQNPENVSWFPQKILSSTVNDNKKCFSILKWFLKDHVTLKTGIMAAENTAVYSILQ